VTGVDAVPASPVTVTVPENGNPTGGVCARRAILCASAPSKLEKRPASTTEPSGATAAAATMSSAPGVAVSDGSSAPAASSRARRVLGVPPYAVKDPAVSRPPAGARTMVRTAPFAPDPAANAPSRAPCGSRRAMRPRSEASTLVKKPPMTMLPSGSMRIAATSLSAPTPGSKVTSSVPSASRRAMRLRSTPA
jgi:hypothetical protein